MIVPVELVVGDGAGALQPVEAAEGLLVVVGQRLVKVAVHPVLRDHHPASSHDITLHRTIIMTHCTVGEIRVFCPMGVLGVFI